MRSRYTAHVLKARDYLVATHDPATAHVLTPQERSGDAVDPTCWVGLVVEEVVKGGPQDDEGIVQFVARYTEGDDPKVKEHIERSRFRKVDGRWVYSTGEYLFEVPPLPKVKRNDPCPCESGKKYKHCCA